MATALFRPLEFRSGTLHLLDQRLLPAREEWVEIRSAAATAAAIRTMMVRGAPAIGIAAAYGLALAAAEAAAAGTDVRTAVRDAAADLGSTRPTAVNLRWALDRMLRLAATVADPALPSALEAEALAIHEEDIESNRRLGRFGAALLGDDVTLLTHCNAGALATGGYGTALGIVRAARESGKKVAVFADETRPFLQGARLTAWELARDGFDVTLITDSMAGHFFQRGAFDGIVVGADRIAANGDTANKIGTYTVAVLAARHGVPFYVAAPFSTVDLATPDGAHIPIEERSADEVVEVRAGGAESVRIAPEGIHVRHPAFDVTPAELITAIVTDRGVARPPFADSLRKLSS